MRSPRFLLAAVCHCVPLSALGAPKARQCRQSIAKRQLCATVLRDSVPLWCSAAPVLRICRSAHSDFIPPCRILQSLSKIIVFCRLFGVSRPRKSYPIFHTRCVAGLLLKMRARPGATWNLRIVICEFHVVPGSFLFSGDFRQSKPDLACGRGATRQARPVNGERTRQ